MKRVWHEYLEYILLVSLITIITISGIIAICVYNHNNQYNNGICTKCGGRYEFLQAVGHFCETGFLYKCADCNNIIEIDNYR